MSNGTRDADRRKEMNKWLGQLSPGLRASLEGAYRSTEIADKTADPATKAKIGAAQDGLINSAKAVAEAKGKAGNLPAGNKAQAAAVVAAPEPPAIGGTISPAEMNDEEIAAAIMDKQAAILEGWATALLIFDKTMTSSSDAEATPDFQKVVVGYFSEKLMGSLMSATPVSSELNAMIKGLSGEYDRAKAAGASATLRDFVNQHWQAIGRLKQATLNQRESFVAAVRKRREAYESKPGKPGRKGTATVDDSKEGSDYGMMRMELMDTLEKVDKVLSRSTSETLFRVLSEEWTRHQTVAGGMGTRFPAVVIIRLNPNYTVKNAHIQGAGGQKLAEQMLKDSPGGVDVFHLKAPRRIMLYADNGWPSAILSLDADNRDISTGSIAEGDTDSLKKYVMTKGLQTTTHITGD